MVGWHWQERFDGANLEAAYRVQVLKIHKQVSFTKWLQQKREHHKQLDVTSVGQKDHCLTDQQFMDWVRRKRLQRKAQESKTNATASKKSPPILPATKTPKQREDVPFKKPPSLHVNPKAKRPAKKMKKDDSDHINKTPAVSREQSIAAYKEWEQRKKREDRVKRQQTRQQKELQRHAQRALHALQWKKKGIVCAYSTNHGTPPHYQPTSKAAVLVAA